MVKAYQPMIDVGGKGKLLLGGPSWRLYDETWLQKCFVAWRAVRLAVVCTKRLLILNVSKSYGASGTQGSLTCSRMKQRHGFDDN